MLFIYTVVLVQSTIAHVTTVVNRNKIELSLIRVYIALYYAFLKVLHTTNDIYDSERENASI